MSKFGWDYPAGAEHDPNAPWNEVECPECEDLKTMLYQAEEIFSDLLVLALDSYEYSTDKGPQASIEVGLWIDDMKMMVDRIKKL